MANPWFETVAEAQRRAKRRLPKGVYGALVAGSEKGLTAADNIAAFDEIGFAPHTAGLANAKRMATTIMGQEVSRLARSSLDWHHLLEICAMTETLILDEDGVYDPSHFNDRLLLGLKGTRSEAELHVLRARLQGGILNKARRGELQCPLPVGFVYNANNEPVSTPTSRYRKAFDSSSRHSGALHRPARLSKHSAAKGFCFRGV